MATEYMVRLRKVEPEELLPEEEVLKKDPENPFLGPGDRPEPYRSYYIAYARLEPVFQKEKVHPPLLAETPKGKGLIWRLWPSEIGIMLLQRTKDGMALEEKPIFLKNEDVPSVKLIVDEIVLNPPKWH